MTAEPPIPDGVIGIAPPATRHRALAVDVVVALAVEVCEEVIGPAEADVAA